MTTAGVDKVVGAVKALGVVDLAGCECRNIGSGSRAALQVVHLTVEPDSLLAQAADGFSAGSVRENVQGIQQQTSLSLPWNFARLLTTLVDEHDTVRIGTSGPNRILFQITNAEQAKELTLATVTGAENFPAAQIAELRAKVADLAFRVGGDEPDFRTE